MTFFKFMSIASLWKLNNFGSNDDCIYNTINIKTYKKSKLKSISVKFIIEKGIKKLYLKTLVLPINFSTCNIFAKLFFSF